MNDFLGRWALKKASEFERVVIVASGKGGVGKSFVSSCLALTMADRGLSVGLLDLDLHGPSTTSFLGVGRVRASKEGLIPARRGEVEYMSLALLTEGTPLPFKGEDKWPLIYTMMAMTKWSANNLVVDMPPGTGDEFLWALRSFNRRKSKVLVVTTPSKASIEVVRRAINMIRDERFSLLGVVENMSYLSCGGEKVKPFGEVDYSNLGVRVIARIPMEPSVEEAIRSGDPPHKSSPELERAFNDLVEVIINVPGDSR